MKIFSLIPTGWEICQLHKVAQKCTKKNKDHNISLVLTNSAVYGVVPQSEHFKKEIATDENIHDYYVIEPGEFVYNPRISVTAPCGPIRRNHLRLRGVMSPLYTIFKLKNGKADDRYLEYYFLSPSWHKFAKSVANYGARHDRMAIKDDDFFAMPIPLPPLPEQKRIAEILTEQDKLIALKERLIATKKKQKKWLMQNLLTGKIRLEGFSEEWQEKFLEDIATVNMGQSPNSQNYNTEGLGLPLIQGNADIDNRRTIAKTFTSQTTRKANLGDIIMSVRAPVGKVAVATFECCIGRGVCAICGSEYVKQLLLYYECNWSRLSQGSTFDSVNGKEIRRLKFKIPLSNEQTAIAERLTAADQEIELLTKELEAQKQVKKYLMQQLLTGKIRVTGGEV